MKPDDDLPEITDDMLARAELRIGERVIRRGRPPGPPTGAGGHRPNSQAPSLGNVGLFRTLSNRGRLDGGVGYKVRATRRRMGPALTSSKSCHQAGRSRFGPAVKNS